MVRFGNSRLPKNLRSRGQMMVELAVCIPVILAVIGITLNILGYMNVCARFDRVAADAVRSQACSPGYGEEGMTLSASRVREVIETSLASGGGNWFDCEVSVAASPAGFGTSGYTETDRVSFSMLSRLERYECAITYHPWPFSSIVFLEFIELTHTRSYIVDPFRTGVLF